MLRNIFGQKLLSNSVIKNSSFFHTSVACLKADDRKEMIASMPKRDQGTTGEKTIEIDQLIQQKKMHFFPDEDTPTKLFDGVMFKDLPIVNIRVSKNNTILSLTNAAGNIQMIRSCGVEGFKNTKKGTNIAAQATAITFCGKMIDRGVKQARVTVRGLGPGRMSAIKGLQMAGLNIVSITDTTRVSWNPPRPRKQRKL